MRSIEQLQLRLREFARERDWEQFHSAKNLSCALAVEAGELLEIFQWESDHELESLEQRELERIGQEAADVFIYLVRLADRLGLDLLQEAERKLAINAKKYPADLARGTSRKYTEL